MTIQMAIDVVDQLKPNMFSPEQKVAWLNDLDGLVWREVVMTHEWDEQYGPFDGYDQSTDPSTKLLVPEPYTDIYRHYLAAQMDLANRETGEYTKDMVLFNSAWQTLCDYWNRTHTPLARVKHLRF